MRKQYGKTQQQIADIINTSQSSYAHYENARNLMPLSFLYNLRKYIMIYQQMKCQAEKEYNLYVFTSINFYYNYLNSNKKFMIFIFF